ncbi:hypothetical protein EYC80_010479 [Monilinia laxa]|uniref:Amino acid permease/ SLC12A domain-containing protein n=1 Tax=Monilinia laxa TaxID=61186 RepID=A0A5N6JN30_MONLA|nr:hypothetical protein EYC80_010479 [Monilinia laxa]
MLTMLSLGEMAAYVPIAGSFCTFAGRYVDGGLGFALTWNYWFNDAVSTAADLVALQLVWAYWGTWGCRVPGWGLALIFWVFLIAANIITVKAYGELEYWLSLLKVVTVTIFIILGIVVNCGGNTSHTYLGAHYWHIGDAPFVGGIGGFASVFVTASFAYGGTESIAITAGETKEPDQKPPPSGKERLLAHPNLLYSFRPANRSQRPLQLPQPLQQENHHLPLHHNIPNGGRQSRRILHQRRDPHIRHQRRKSRSVRRNPPPLHPIRRRPRPPILRKAQPQSGPLGRGPSHQRHQRPLFWREFHRRRAAVELAAESRWGE